MARFVHRTYISPCILDRDYDSNIPSYLVELVTAHAINSIRERSNREHRDVCSPRAVLGVTMTGGTMRMTRTMMLEVLRQDYIRTAWAKGLKERVVVIRHALRNALIPVITIIGMQIPMVIGGSVIIEQIFNLPGLGRMMLTALQERDYPTISGINLFVAVLVIIINILVDVSYGWLDPRIHYQ